MQSLFAFLNLRPSYNAKYRCATIRSGHVRVINYGNSLRDDPIERFPYDGSIDPALPRLTSEEARASFWFGRRDTGIGIRVRDRGGARFSFPRVAANLEEQRGDRNAINICD